MPTYAEKLEAKITAKVQVKLNPDLPAEGVSGINPLLVPVVEAMLQALSELMSGCLDKFRDPMAVARRRKRLGLFQRMALRNAIRRQPELDEYYVMATEVLTETIIESEEDEAIGLMREYQSERIDWSPWGFVE